jgi:uroporphyrinogen decarboxylase
MYEAPEEVLELLKFTNAVAKAMAGYYIDSGCDVIAVVDPMTSQIDPSSFEMFISKPEKELFDLIRKKNALSSFFVCGHAQHNIELMCACEPDNVSIDENIPLEYVRDIALENEISFGGNMKLTVVLLMGSVDDVNQETIECMDRGGKKGFILAPGCDLPMQTPRENLIAVTKLVHDTYQQDVVREIEKQEQTLELMNMKDYGHTDKIIVDIITLDSESCAPCQYMVEAVKQVAPHFEGIVEWREHAIKRMESVTFMNSLMVKNIPTICIDGKIVFVSKIPPRNDLINAIQNRINEKLRLKISSKRARIYVIGKSEKEFVQIKENIETAIKETGRQLEVKYTTDKEMRLSFGISVTPAVVVADYKLKSQGEVPKVEIIREWIKELH